MSSQEHTRRYPDIEDTHRFSFLGSRVAMFNRSLRGCNVGSWGGCNLPCLTSVRRAASISGAIEHKEKVVSPVFAWDLVVRLLHSSLGGVNTPVESRRANSSRPLLQSCNRSVHCRVGRRRRARPVPAAPRGLDWEIRLGST